MPVILRRKPGTRGLMVVGDSIVYTMMDGEGLNVSKLTDIELH